jgi:hypothetical protein
VSKTRNNHYVPQWYQRGFLEEGRDTLRYVDLRPTMHPQRDGSSRPGRSTFDWAPAKCFYQTDLYSTHFLFHVDDEIERRLFGDIDGRGSAAVRDFAEGDAGARVEGFGDLLEYLDAQRLRTPKGLDWLQLHYPALDQNQLMHEMQGVRMVHTTLWSECVREIVSAEDAGVKFIVTDHPVTTYNHAVPPGDPRLAYPGDPSTAWKATQTLFALNRDLCLILTNLEYAQQPDLADPCAKRIHARNFRPALVHADHLIRTRRLDDGQVRQINHVLRSRARRYLAAGRKEWLSPETPDRDMRWDAIRRTLLPPADEIGMFGGETFIGYGDGRVEYRDAFGRSEPRPDFLSRPGGPSPVTKADPCGCGSGHPFDRCCAGRPAGLRPSWSELSIRERNLILVNAVVQITGIAQGLDWTEVRRGLTAEKIAEIYRVHRALWPEDTDLVSLLPKPDGRLRALFTGIVDPRTLNEYAFGAANMFGELLIQNPFIRDAHMRPEYSPVGNPGAYHVEAIKHVSLLVELAPLIDSGMVNLFPDPCSFDPFLRSQMMHMADERSEPMRGTIKPDPRTWWLAEDDGNRAVLFAPENYLRQSMRASTPGIDEALLDDTIAMLRDTRHLDPLAPLNLDLFESGEEGGILIATQLAPNFEISLYLAQATGSVIVTDHPHRWRELNLAARPGAAGETRILHGLAAAIEREELPYLHDTRDVLALRRAQADHGFRGLMGDVLSYLSRGGAGSKPNWESQLPNRVARATRDLRKAVLGTNPEAMPGRTRCLIPGGGIRDNTVDRLLLMTGVERHADNVPMAFIIERPDTTSYDRPFLSQPWRWRAAGTSF